MSLIGSTNEEKIWNYLKAKGLPDCGIAGLMGNLYAESSLVPTNLQNSYEKALSFTDAAYTAAVDNGTYQNFVKDSAGYGLAQWTYWSRKKNLLDFAKKKGKSIGDLEMQLDFLWNELQGYTVVISTLKTAKTVRAASDSVLLNFERPADQSEAAKTRRAGFGQKFYDKYAADSPAQKGVSGVSKCYASAVIAVAIGELGYVEKASNSQLDSKTANPGSANWTKYARDFDEKYPKWYNGKKNGYEWCDMFVDWCFVTAFGYENALRLLCQPERSCGAGCTWSAKYYKQKGQFHTSNPKMGDQIFFGTSIDNCTHTGLMEKVDASKVYTIEGNTNNQCARRSYALNSAKIVGYGRPAYDAEPGNTNTGSQTPSSGTTSEVTYTVVAGDTLSKIAAKYGTTYQKLAAYNGITNPNIIRVGQKIKIPGTAAPKKTNAEIAKEVIAGKWGNGADRKRRLEAAGYDYNAIQQAVNAALAR